MGHDNINMETIAQLTTDELDARLYKINGQYYVTTDVILDFDNEKIPIYQASFTDLQENNPDLTLYNTCLQHVLVCKDVINKTLTNLQAQLTTKIEERI